MAHRGPRSGRRRLLCRRLSECSCRRPCWRGRLGECVRALGPRQVAPAPPAPDWLVAGGELEGPGPEGSGALQDELVAHRQRRERRSADGIHHTPRRRLRRARHLDVAASPLLPGVGAQHIAQLAPRLLLALRRLAPPARPHFVAADPSNGAEGLAGSSAHCARMGATRWRSTTYYCVVLPYYYVVLLTTNPK